MGLDRERAAGAAALAFSALFALWTLVHAIRIEPVPESPAPQFAGSNALRRRCAAPDVDVAAAVETDPFAADRSAPADRIALPGEEGDDAGPKAVAVLDPVVLGTGSRRMSAQLSRRSARGQPCDDHACRRQDRRLHRKVHRARARRIHDAVREERSTSQSSSHDTDSDEIPLRVALLVAAATSPLEAQARRRGAQPARDTTPVAHDEKTDTQSRAENADGFVLDFQEQELRVVLEAIAEAGGLNVTFANLPATKVTLRMGQR